MKLRDPQTPPSRSKTKFTKIFRKKLMKSGLYNVLALSLYRYTHPPTKHCKLREHKHLFYFVNFVILRLSQIRLRKKGGLDVHKSNTRSNKAVARRL
jgi:hypothetical protein